MVSKQFVMMLCFFCFFSSCGTSQTEVVNPDGKNDTILNRMDVIYNIGIDVDYPPFSYEDVDKKKVCGMDIELFEEVAKVMKINYRFKLTYFKNIISSLLSSQLDGAIAAISITPERKKILDFSNAYYTSSTVFVFPKTIGIQGLDDLHNRVVGVQIGTLGEKLINRISAGKNITVRYFDSSSEMFRDLMYSTKQHKIQVGLDEFLVTKHRMRNNVNYREQLSSVVFEDEDAQSDYAFAVMKDKNQDLVQAFNKGLKIIKENGIYDKILKKYET